MAEVPSRHDRLLSIVDLAGSLDADADTSYYGLPGRIDQLRKHNEWLHELQEQTLALIEENNLCIDALSRCLNARE